MLRRLLLLASVVMALAAGTSRAQHWTKVLQMKGMVGSSAFFFNQNEGVIGTGLYLQGTPAQILYTADGGATWHQAQMPNPGILGEVNDIFFRSRSDGWAAIRETIETGWSGIYHSSDAGHSWKLVHQAGFPGSVKATKRGVFYTERDNNPGLYFSNDGGATFRQTAITDVALDVDFMDEATAFVTTQAYALGPHLISTDSGITWKQVATKSECWTAFGDPISRNFILASERDNTGVASQSAIALASATTGIESVVNTFDVGGVSGGAAGYRGCTTVAYIQGRKPGGNSTQGLIRTLDGGASWVTVGGPLNRADTRFAVTGRGAVVYAFDSLGGVWRTSDGGDGTLSPSILPFVSMTPQFATTQSSLCDSAIVPILLSYRACDSAQIANVQFLNDSLGELSVPGYANAFRYFSTASLDTLRLLFQPIAERSWAATLRVTVRQSDGSLEDTLITVNLMGLAAKPTRLTYTGMTSPNTIDFDSVSVCIRGDRRITLQSTGCGDVAVTAMQTTGPFTLRSNFSPFTMSRGNTRTFLLEYSPTAPTAQVGSLIISSQLGHDTIALRGLGYLPNSPLDISVPQVTSSLCDSARFEISVRNLGCAALLLDSAATSGPLGVIGISQDSIKPGETATIELLFAPSAAGQSNIVVHIHLHPSGGSAIDKDVAVSATAVPGSPALTLNKQSLFGGSVSICESVLDTLVLQNTGCGDLTEAASIDIANAGFAITRPVSNSIHQGASDTLIVLFQPSQQGSSTATLILTSSAGNKTLPLQEFVTPDPGHLTITSTPSLVSSLCASQPFAVRLRNTSCDSLVIDDYHIHGVDSDDFHIPFFTATGIATNDTASLSGVFSPLDSLTRSAQLTLTIRRKDGTQYDTSITLTAQAVAVTPIVVALPPGSLTAKNQSPVRISCVARAVNELALGSLDVTLQMNTDLLSPSRIVPAQGSFGNAKVTRFKVYADSLSFRLEFASDSVIAAGELCEVECIPFVTSTMTTQVSLARAVVGSAGAQNGCLTTQALADSTILFTLDPACGEPIVSQYMANQPLTLTAVSPNPSHGEVTLTFHVAADYANDGTLQVYDELGKLRETHPLIFGRGAREASMVLKLEGEGARYLRVETPQYVTSRRVSLVK